MTEMFNTTRSDDPQGSAQEGDHKQVARRHAEDSLIRSSSELAVVTADALQQYVAQERRRNFRALCWLSSIFLLLILAVSALLISFGISVTKESRLAMKTAMETDDNSRVALAGYKHMVELAGSNVAEVAIRADRVSEALQEEKDRYNSEKEVLRRDLQRFSRQYESKYTGLRDELSEVARLSAKLGELERLETTRKERLDEIEKWCLENKARLESLAASADTISAAVPATSGPVVVVSDPAIPGGTVETRAYSNGDRYSGELKDGFRHGKGTYWYNAGDRYEGEFKNGKMDGRGAYYYANGSVFKGEFKNGMKNGNGAYTDASGAKISGVWQDDAPRSTE